MAKEVFPVTKSGKFFGYADAEQIAQSDGALEIFDASKAAAFEAQAKVDAAKAAEADKAAKLEAAKGTGADAAAVKKGPAN